LIAVAGQCPLIVSQVRQESEAPDAFGADFLAVDDDGAVEELAEIVPVEVPSWSTMMCNKTISKRGVRYIVVQKPRCRKNRSRSQIPMVIVVVMVIVKGSCAWASPS
jgi:hypothetical protein